MKKEFKMLTRHDPLPSAAPQTSFLLLLLHDGRPGVHCVLNRSETAPGLKSSEDSPELELRGIVTQTEHIFIKGSIKYCPKYGAARL